MYWGFTDCELAGAIRVKKVRFKFCSFDIKFIGEYRYRSLQREEIIVKDELFAIQSREVKGNLISKMKRRRSSGMQSFVLPLPLFL